MFFKRTLQRYGQTPEPITPYQKAAQLWDDRIGSARVQAANWRLMAFGCLTLAVGLSAGLVWQSARSRITPYVVEVDRLGEVQAVAPAITPYQPSDAQIAWYLGRFITDVRSLSIDPVLVRRNWLEAYDLASKRAALFLSDFARTTDPFKAIGDRSVSVEVTSVVRASDTSFQVKWTEQTYRQGSLTSTELDRHSRNDDRDTAYRGDPPEGSARSLHRRHCLVARTRRRHHHAMNTILGGSRYAAVFIHVCPIHLAAHPHRVLGER